MIQTGNTQKIIMLMKVDKVVILVMKNEENNFDIFEINNNRNSKIGTLNIGLNSIKTLNVSSKKEHVALIDNRSIVSVYSYGSFNEENVSNNHSNGNRLLFSEDGKFLISYSDKVVKNIWEYNLKNWSPLEISESDYIDLKIQFPDKKNYYCFKSDNIDLLISGKRYKIDHKKYSKIIDETLIKTLSYEESTNEIRCEILKASNKNSSIQAIHRMNENQIEIWSTSNSLKLIQTISDISESINRIQFNPEGDILIASDSISIIRIWQRVHKKLYREKFRIKIDNPNFLDFVAVSNKYFVIIQNKQNKLVIWEINFGEKLCENFSDYLNQIKNVRVSEEKSVIVLNSQSTEYMINLNSCSLTSLKANKEENSLPVEKKYETDKSREREEIGVTPRQLVKFIEKDIRKKETFSEIVIEKQDTQAEAEIDRVRQDISIFRENIFKEKTNISVYPDNSPIRKANQQKLIINVGLDIGTSNTKVAYRVVNTNQVSPIILMTIRIAPNRLFPLN